MVVVEDVPEAVVDHVVVDLGVRHPHPVAVTALGHEERRHIHVLDAAGEDHVRVAQSDLLCGGDYGLQARAAHPVEGHTGHLDRQPALYAYLATRVHPLARRQYVADDYLVHLLALDAGAGEHLLADRSPEVGGRRVLERPAEGAYPSPERRRDDYLAVAVSVTEAHECSFPCDLS
jgi:hypothetical protein